MSLDLTPYGYPEIKINQVREERKLDQTFIGAMNRISNFVKTYSPRKENSPGYIWLATGPTTTIMDYLLNGHLTFRPFLWGVTALGVYAICKWSR